MAGCARNLTYFDKVQRTARQGQFVQAADLIKASADKYAQSDRVLYHLDRGMLFLYAGTGDQALEYLTLAEKDMDELFAKSLTAQAVSLVTNDYVLPYPGLDYEQLLISAFLSLAYASQGRMEDALVEARRMDSKCDLLKQKHSDGKGILDDGFARYLSGLYYENDRDWDNAYISYYTALKAFRQGALVPVPSGLLAKVFALAKKTGRDDDLKELAGKYGAAPASDPALGQSEIVVVSFLGDGPLLASKEFAATALDAEGKTWHLKFAVPEFRQTVSFVNGVDVFLPNSAGAASEPVEDTRALCRNDLDNRMGGIVAKTTARVLAKTIATHKLKQKMYTNGNPLANALIGITTDALADQLEHADTRVCRLFAGNVLLARVPVQPGSYDLTLGLRTAQGSERTAPRKVEVKAGEKRFVLFADLR